MMTSVDETGPVSKRVRLDPVGMSAIPLGGDKDLTLALAAFQRQAHEILDGGAGFARLVSFGGTRADWLAACRAALTAQDALTFFTTNFKAYRVHDVENAKGLFTGYYEPEVAGSRSQTAEFPVPLYRKPDDLVTFTEQEHRLTGLRYGRRDGGRALPYIERREIERGALSGRGLEICWVKTWAEAFFLQIQGSGRVLLPGGEVLRLSYAAKSGLPYTGIGGVLAARGTIPREQMSMQSLKAWMNVNPDDARHLMWQNKSFVFFREITVTDEALGAVGAARVHLTPGRSLAVDRSNWMFGTPVWLETSYPPEAQRTEPDIKRLMIAQDTGSAIRGFARGDLYWGWGEDAAVIAGHMKSPGRMTVLLPHAVAHAVGLP